MKHIKKIYSLRDVLWEHKLYKLYRIIEWLNDSIYDFKYGLLNFKTFRGSIWRFRLYDYSYLLDIIETAARQMSDLHRRNGHLDRSQETAEQLKSLADLCSRLKRDDHDYSLDAGYLEDPEEWNKLSKYKQKQVFKKSRDQMSKDLKEFSKQWLGMFSWWD